MKKANATCYGCLTGMIALVLVVAAVSYITDYLYDAPFYYKEMKHAASPNERKHAYLFSNSSKKNLLAPYVGVSLSRDERINRNYNAEVFAVSPPDALDSMDLIWLDNETIELKFRVNPEVKSRIHYGRPPSLVRRVIFTELFETSESTATNMTMEPKR